MKSAYFALDGQSVSLGEIVKFYHKGGLLGMQMGLFLALFHKFRKPKRIYVKCQVAWLQDRGELYGLT